MKIIFSYLLLFSLLFSCMPSMKVEEEAQEESSDGTSITNPKESEEDEVVDEFINTIPEVIDATESDSEDIIDLAPSIHFSLDSGIYTQSFNLIIRCVRNGSYSCQKIAFTTNGDDPSFESDNGSNIIESSSVQIRIGETLGVHTVKAIAQSVTGRISAIVIRNYQISSALPMVYAMPSSGEYHSSQKIILNCKNCSNIAYSINGPDPDFSGAYTIVGPGSSITIGQTSGDYVLKLISRSANGMLSDLYETSYKIIYACNGDRISETGYFPCDYTCGSGSFEKGANFGNTACKCKATHSWDTSKRRCLINQVTNFFILNND